MKWIKRGVIYTNPQRAQMPTALLMEDRIRIYYNIRDEKSRARCHFIDVDKDNPKKIIGESKKEVLPLGKLGAFDDAGVMPGSVYYGGNDIIFMAYTGYSLAKDVPYKGQNAIAASFDKGKTFKFQHTSELALYFATTPLVRELSSDLAAYGKGWVNIKGKLEPVYRIGFSDDNESLTPKSKYEVQCRPTIIKIKDTYHMYFCYRDSFDFRGGKGSYRIGYASSNFPDGPWRRNDKKARITVGKKGEFDSQMTCYPNIVKVGENYIMFYNGSGFGATGFGYAELEI